MQLERLVRYTGLMVMLALHATARPAEAESEPPSGTEAVSATCNLSAHRRYAVAWSPVIRIPDNNPAGITTPPLHIPYDGSVLWDVAIEPKIFYDRYYSHLILSAHYDIQCDGVPEASVDLLNRACIDLGHTTLQCITSYVFSDRATAGGVRCLSPEPAGCFWPMYWTSAEPALRRAFDGLPTGGCFTLTASDHVTYYTGYLCGLAVYTSGTLPVPTLAPSWGALKLFYR